MHKDEQAPAEPHYWVMAKLCEPDYKAEIQFIGTEMAFVERKIAQLHSSAWRKLSVPALGIYSQADWRKYHQSLAHYGKQLSDYAREVTEGVMPVQFAVYNASGRADQQIAVRVRVEDGRVDEKKKPPARPPRIDGSRKTDLKFEWPALTGFVRTKIKISGHAVTAELSRLGAHDAAILVNQVVHLHTASDTQLTYEIHSSNVAHEAGEVTF